MSILNAFNTLKSVISDPLAKEVWFPDMATLSTIEAIIEFHMALMRLNLRLFLHLQMMLTILRISIITNLITLRTPTLISKTSLIELKFIYFDKRTYLLTLSKINFTY
jgi:hypothetical protein